MTIHVPSRDLPFGIDVSSWQGEINWDAVNLDERNVQFVGIRAAISWGWEDPMFKRNWAEAKRVGKLRTAYHVFYPRESATRQMDHFLAVLGNDLGELAPSFDLELTHSITPPNYLKNLKVALDYFENRTGMKPIIYSRAGFIDECITGSGNTPPDWYNELYYWFAQYLISGAEHQGPPRLARGVDRSRVLIHQTGDKTPAMNGIPSNTLDWNRWQAATAIGMRDYVDEIHPPVVEPEPEPEPEPKPEPEPCFNEENVRLHLGRINKAVASLRSELDLTD